MRASRSVVCLAVLAVSWALWGCSSPGHLIAYDGPRRPPEEVARIESSGADKWTFHMLGGTSLYLLRVDGRALEAGGGNLRYLNWAEVLPGPHVVTAFLKFHELILFGMLGQAFGESGAVTLRLEAQAGHTYRVRGVATSPQASFWVEDAATGEVVVGRRP